MSSELIIAGALANCGREAPTEEFLETLARETPGLAVFRFRPKPRPGMGVKAALDWQAILGTAADLLAFAGVIWAAYERYVKPKRDRSTGTQRPFLLISLRRSDGSFTQFALGNEYTEKEVFIEHFTQQVRELRESTNTEPDHALLSEITKSEDWVRIHVRDKTDS
jgi:hypothetical protein